VVLCFDVLSRYFIVDSKEYPSNRSQPFYFCAIGLLSGFCYSVLCYCTTLYGGAKLASTISTFMVSLVLVCLRLQPLINESPKQDIWQNVRDRKYDLVKREYVSFEVLKRWLWRVLLSAI
jgi:hypothetical protein